MLKAEPLSGVLFYPFQARDQYFRGGVEELREKIAAAQVALNALLTVCASISKGR
jgi:hypothetical protein